MITNYDRFIWNKPNPNFLSIGRQLQCQFWNLGGGAKLRKNVFMFPN